jgi:uncharacterized membrane protein YfcA
VNFEALITIAVSSVFFAPLGAKVTHLIDSNKLKKGFSIFLAFLAAMVILF